MAFLVPYFAPFTNLDQIKPYKSSWRIQVKILHTWKWSSPVREETTEMILADALFQGMLIHASIKKADIPRFARFIVPGEWLIIHHFYLIQASGSFRPAKHFCQIVFMNTTTVLESPNISNDLYLDLESYEDIADIEALNENILIDVIGQVVICGELETRIAANMSTTKLDLELRDTNDNRLGCTLWGKYADTMWDACQNVGNNVLTCILRFAKIITVAGERRVSSAFEISMLFINPEFPEALTFRGNLKKDGLALTMKKRTDFDNGEVEDGQVKSG